MLAEYTLKYSNTCRWGHGGIMVKGFASNQKVVGLNPGWVMMLIVSLGKTLCPQFLGEGNFAQAIDL